jgi:hypothetical protein
MRRRLGETMMDAVDFSGIIGGNVEEIQGGETHAIKISGGIWSACLTSRWFLCIKFALNF